MKIPKIIDAMANVDDRYILEAAECGAQKGKGEKTMNKKKFLIIAAVIAACVCLMAFSYTLFDSKDYLEDYDVDPNYMMPDVMLASNGDNYFGIIPTQRGFRLMNYDTNTETATEVCAVEGCNHTDSGICTALQFPGYTGVSVYEGRVYWAAFNKNDLAQLNIMSALPDGSDCQVHKSVPREVISDFNTQMYVRAHRGYMYFAGLMDSAYGYNLRITVEELTENGESFTVFETSEGNVGYDWNMQIYANTMYIYFSTYKCDADGNAVLDNDGYRIWTDLVYSYDIQTRKLTKLYSGHLSLSSDNCWFDNDGNLYYVTYSDKNDCYALIKLNPANGKTETVFNMSEINLEEYNYVDVLNGLVVAKKKASDEVLVRRFDSSSVTLDYSSGANYLRENYGGFFSFRLAGSDDNYLFFLCCDDENFMAIPLDGSEPKLIISRVTADPNWGYWLEQ